MPTENVNVNRGSVYDGLDNFPGHAIQDYTGGAREYKPWFEKLDWKVEAVRAVVLLLSLMVAWALFGIWRAGYCWDSRNWQACERIDAIQPVGAFAAILLVVGLPAARVLLWALGEYQLNQARAARVATTFNDWGTPVRVDLMTAPEYEPDRFAQRVELKRATAPYEVFHSVNTYSPSFQAPKEAPALPAPTEVPIVVWDAWREWADEVPHRILAAETGGGKTTTEKALLAPRIDGGEHVFIIDPHSDDWFGLPNVGGGENWTEVAEAIDVVIAEYQRRMAERDRYLRETGQAMPVDAWQRLTVLLDEANITRLRFDQASRGKVNRWQSFAEVLGSGARKVRIGIDLLCQSALVEDLGLSGSMRRNFFRIGLDHAVARQMLRDEPNPERRKALATLLEGQRFPAICEYRGQFHVLDRTGLDQLPAPHQPQAAWWSGWSARQPSVPPLTRQAVQEKAIRNAIAAGWTRDEARARGLSFDNNVWSRLGGR